MRWLITLTLFVFVLPHGLGSVAHGQADLGNGSGVVVAPSRPTRLPSTKAVRASSGRQPNYGQPQVQAKRPNEWVDERGAVRLAQGLAEQIPSTAPLSLNPPAQGNLPAPLSGMANDQANGSENPPQSGPMRGRAWGGGTGQAAVPFALPPQNFPLPPQNSDGSFMSVGEAGALDPREPRLQWGETAASHLVTLHADNAPLTDILRLIAQKHQLNLVVGPNVAGVVTLSLENAQLEEVLDAILSITGHAWNRRGNLLYVTRLSTDQPVQSTIQGRALRVFPLNFIAAADSQAVVAGLLSPVGQVFISESDSADQAKTRELLVVDDVPEAIQRVEMYLLEVDQPPQQVQIEAHVMQVVLDDLNRHGVNLKPLARIGSGSVTFETLGFANPDMKSGMKMALDGTDITGLVELIQSRTNARTLASPKLLVANRQEANIQIGKRLSYLTTTTTQTASVQSVQFLDTGVVLNVVPTISNDGQILMVIQPKVSGGQLNAETDLPEEESTELATTVLMPDGGGVIIGGLMKEEDFDSVSEVPGLCRIPILGHLFRRVEVTTKRTEIIIALVAHIVPSIEQMRQHELNEVRRALPDYAEQELRVRGIESVQPANPNFIQSP